jgi:hypothetical protein
MRVCHRRRLKPGVAYAGRPSYSPGPPTRIPS